MLVCLHPGLFFRVHLASWKSFFYHFKMEKIVLILIYNIFVTKKFFYRNEHQKNFSSRTFLVDPVKAGPTNIFLSLAQTTFYSIYFVHTSCILYYIFCPPTLLCIVFIFPSKLLFLVYILWY